MTTSSPAATPSTPGPTAETTPAPSEPRTAGSFAFPPRRIHQSRRLREAATRSTRTWPGPGSGSGTSEGTRPVGSPNARSSTASMLDGSFRREEDSVRRLDGKVCVITGAGGGIGKAAALRFAEEGGRIACADVVEETGAATAAEIVSAGAEAEFFRVDVADPASVGALYAAAERRFGAVHVLFNNAGVLLPGDGSGVATDPAVWHRVLDINLTGVFLCCKHGIPKLLAAGGGPGINKGSISGLVGSATSQIAYAASKGGVIALTRDVAAEFARGGGAPAAPRPPPARAPPP